MSAFEIFRFRANSTLVAKPSAIKPALDLGKNFDGFITSYYGIAEDEKTAYVIVEWKTVGHHKDAMSNPEYLKVQQIIGGLNDKPTSHFTYHAINFNKDPIPILEAPTTELTILTLKDGKTEDELELALVDLANKLHREAGTYGATWGLIPEDPRKIAMWVGWDSVDVHREIKKGEKYAGISKDIAQHCDHVSVHHVRLIQVRAPNPAL